MEILGRFGRWGGGSRELQPKDVLRKVIEVLEDNCKEGLDDKVYVPNKYVLEFSINERERGYLFSFLDEQELITVLQQFMVQHGYFTRAPLEVVIKEVSPTEGRQMREKLRVTALFEKVAGPSPAAPPSPLPPDPLDIADADIADSDAVDDLATVGSIALADDDLTRPAAGWAALAVTGVDGGKRFIKLTKQVIYIGRSRNAGNDIVLENDDKASKVHARIERERDGQYTLYDLDSTNGVMIADAPIKGNRVLRNQDEITIGSTKLVFQAGTPAAEAKSPAAPPPRANHPAPLPAQPPAPSAGPSLAAAAPLDEPVHLAIGPMVDPPLADVPAAGRTAVQDDISERTLGRAELIGASGVPYVLASQTLVGRSVTADVVLDDPSVSTRHARIVAPDAATYYLEDLGSENGTNINGRRIVRDQRVLLASGDVLEFGQTEMRFVIVPR